MQSKKTTSNICLIDLLKRTTINSLSTFGLFPVTTFQKMVNRYKGYQMPNIAKWFINT